MRNTAIRGLPVAGLIPLQSRPFAITRFKSNGWAKIAFQSTIKTENK